LLSGAALDKSFDFHAHLWAAANIDKLFSNAIEPWKFEPNPYKNNDSLQEVMRFYAPMEYGGRIIISKITVKEMKNPKDGKRIYSIRAIDVTLWQEK
jgi:hypothetical protein